MQFLIQFHAFFAFSTLIMGPLVFRKNNSKIWEKSTIWFYLIAHLITAFTGLFFSAFNEITPFKLLAVLTIINFSTATIYLSKKNFEKAKRNMFPPYIGLCIAFVGTLHPERLLGYKFFISGLKLDLSFASSLWAFLMISSVIGATIIATRSVIENRKSRV